MAVLLHRAPVLVRLPSETGEWAAFGLSYTPHRTIEFCSLTPLHLSFCSCEENNIWFNRCLTRYAMDNVFCLACNSRCSTQISTFSILKDDECDIAYDCSYITKLIKLVYGDEYDILRWQREQLHRSYLWFRPTKLKLNSKHRDNTRNNSVASRICPMNMLMAKVSRREIE